MHSAAPAPFQREGVSTPLLIPHALGTHMLHQEALFPSIQPRNMALGRGTASPTCQIPEMMLIPRQGAGALQGAVQVHELLQQCHQGHRPRPSCEAFPGETLFPSLHECLNPLETHTIFPLPLSRTTHSSNFTAFPGSI